MPEHNLTQLANLDGDVFVTHNFMYQTKVYTFITNSIASQSSHSKYKNLQLYTLMPLEVLKGSCTFSTIYKRKLDAPLSLAFLQLFFRKNKEKENKKKLFLQLQHNQRSAYVKNQSKQSQMTLFQGLGTFKTY